MAPSTTTILRSTDLGPELHLKNPFIAVPRLIVDSIVGTRDRNHGWH